MQNLTQQFQALPETAQYVIFGAGGLIGVLFMVVLFMLISSLIKGDTQGQAATKKMPKKLPIAPIPIMSDRESALHRVLIAAVGDFPDYELHAKVATTAILGPREDEDEKVAAAIRGKMVFAYHDFVIVDRARYPVVIIELDSQESDTSEEQARVAGLPIIRVKNPRVSSREMSERLEKFLK